MGLVELLLIAVGLSMDTFAVSIGKGLALSRVSLRHSLTVGVWFGGFQAFMPLVGYFLGVRFASMVESVDHWIAFLLLSVIGFNMIREALSDEDDEGEMFSGEGVAVGQGRPHADLSPRTMFLLAVATSIDALALGISFAFLRVDVWSAAMIIGITTFVLSVVGLRVGNIFGNRYKSKAEIAGGAVLMIMGLKILLEHTLLA